MTSLQLKRQRWMKELAQCKLPDLRHEWDSLGIDPEFTWISEPQLGLVEIDGRMDRTGAPFRAGVLPATRASLQLPCGVVGIAMVAGDCRLHAGLAALFDGLLQTDMRDVVEPVIRRLESLREARASHARALVASTKVEFSMKAQNDL